MVGLDTSIYFKQQAPDLMGSFEKGLNMRSMLDERNQKAALKDAYNQGMVTNPDGTTSFDSSKVVGALGKAGLGQQAFEAQQNFDKQNKAKQLEQLNMTGQLLGSANDQNSWALAKARASQMGIDVSQIPDQYDPKLKSFLQGQTLSAAQQLQNDLERQRISESAANRAESRADRLAMLGMNRQDKIDAAAIVKAEKEQQLTTPFGMANTADDAKQLKDASEAKKNFDSKIDQMIALREKHEGGASLNREDVARGKQLSKDLLLEYKNMAKLGVLSKSDEDIINAIIPEDPLEYNSPLAALQGQDPTLARLKAFKSDSDADFKNRVETRTRSVKPGTVVDGYIFNGGDPSDQKNWMKVK